MWAGSLILRIGERRDLLVAIRVDTESTLQRLKILFEPWVDTSLDESATLKPALSVRLEPVEADGRGRGGGPQLVPQLRCGSCVMARSRDSNEVLRALAQVLGGANAHDPDDETIWLNMRAFSNGESVLLTDLNRPALVNDRALAQSGIDELAVWSVALQADGSVMIPPPLSNLAWDTICVAPPSEFLLPLRLASIALQSDDDLSITQRIVGIGGRVFSGAWFATIASIAGSGIITSGSDQRALRDHIHSMLRSTEPSE